MLFTKRFTTSAIVVAVLAAVTGCGGSSKLASSTSARSGNVSRTTESAANMSAKAEAGKPATRASFVAAGDAICARLSAELDARPIKSKQDVMRAVPLAIAATQNEYRGLSKLTPPASVATDWGRFLAATREKLEGVAKGGEYARDNNTKAAESAYREAQRSQEHAADIARRDGFKQCGIR